MLGFILWFGLTLGLQDGATIIDRQSYELPPISLAIDIHLENSWLDLYGIYKNDMGKCPWMTVGFMPYRDTYTVGAKASLGQVSLAVEHQCAHPVDPYDRNDLPDFDSWHTKIELRITSASPKD